jgi:hypothetical protein
MYPCEGCRDRRQGDWDVHDKQPPPAEVIRQRATEQWTGDGRHAIRPRKDADVLAAITRRDYLAKDGLSDSLHRPKASALNDARQD